MWCVYKMLKNQSNFFFYVRCFRFLNQPASLVSLGMVCDLDTDFLPPEAGIVVDFCWLAMRILGGGDESESTLVASPKDRWTIKSFSSCCRWINKAWEDTALLGGLPPAAEAGLELTVNPGGFELEAPSGGRGGFPTVTDVAGA